MDNSRLAAPIERIKPNWEQIRSFKTPLQPGELNLTQFLDTNLSKKWEIFVQPFLNGDRPDLVIFNPDVGLMIFEIKDWAPGLYSRGPNEHREVDQYFVSDGKGTYPIPNPITQVERYRKNLIDLNIPRVGEEIDANSKKLSPFRVGLYFHRLTTEQARKLVPVKTKRCAVFGYDFMKPEKLEEIVPDCNIGSSQLMEPDWVDDIRFWLTPPFHSLEQGQTLLLSTEQKRHASLAPQQHQRLRGVAGSGKTLVIAQRAAALAEQGKHVLVVTYNITLWHYIKDHISRARKAFAWDQIEFTHFHGLCSNYLSENDLPWPHEEENVEELLLKVVPQLVLESIQSGINTNNRIYDAILIDEGQDFNKLWYQMLIEFLGTNDELLFVADERQNIYDRNLSWLAAMDGTRFRGPWRELKESYRLSRHLIEKANLYAHTFLGGEGIASIPAQLDMFSPHLLWNNLREIDFENEHNEIWDAYRFLTFEQKIHPIDIVILVPSIKEGWALVQMFKKKYIQANHVFEEDGKKHRHKKSFWMGDSRLKISTIHSFKGWELLNVILITPQNQSEDGTSLDRVIYTAITRTRQNLMVFNRHARYTKYGESWSHAWLDANFESTALVSDFPTPAPI